MRPKQEMLILNVDKISIMHYNCFSKEDSAKKGM
jgi:hypothetical protein